MMDLLRERWTCSGFPEVYNVNIEFHANLQDALAVVLYLLSSYVHSTQMLGGFCIVVFTRQRVDFLMREFSLKYL